MHTANNADTENLAKTIEKCLCDSGSCPEDAFGFPHYGFSLRVELRKQLASQWHCFTLIKLN